MILEGVFVFGSKGFVAICYYTCSYKVAFVLSFFDPFKCILAQKQDHITYLLFKSSYKLCTLILANWPLNASTDPPKNVQQVAHVRGQ